MTYRANPAGGRDEQGERPLYERYAGDPIPNQRQQDKLVAATWRKDATIFRENAVTLQPAERRGFIYRYKDDQNFVHEAWDMVTKIVAAHETRTSEEIADSVEEYPRARQVWLLVNFAPLG